MHTLSGGEHLTKLSPLTSHFSHDDANIPDGLGSKSAF